VQHPVTGICSDKFDVARLRYTHEHRVSWAPCRLGLASSFRARNDKLMAMKVNRVVIHAEVDQANTHTLTVPHNQRSRRRRRSAVQGEPVDSMLMEFGTVILGRMAYSCRMIAKSLSTRGL